LATQGASFRQHGEVMTPILIGYFPKRTLRHPDWPEVAGVEEICSVSSCISEDPDEWIEKWRHNHFYVYDSPDLAWDIVREGERSEFDLYAYKLFPVMFESGQQKPFDISALNALPLPDSFVRLGFDVVSRNGGAAFECSPLSCNSMAEQIAVNRHCLIDDPATALQHAAEFEAVGCEPGPYFVVEVWRHRSCAV
jgi:hypothetical protein